MIYYAICFGILFSGALILFTKNGKSSKLNNSLLFFWLLVLIALCGLRGIHIGKDTGMYRTLFNQAANYSSVLEYFSHYSYYEYGYYLLNYFFAHVTNYQVFLFVLSFISIVPYGFIIKKYSKNWALSLFLYIAFSYYNFCMTGLRQAVAMGFTAIAFHFIKQKDLKRYLLFIILAVLFHTSSLIFLPAYWINKIPLKKITLIISSALMVLAYLLKDTLWNIAKMFARQTFEEIDSGGEKAYLFMILTIILGIIYRNMFMDNNNDSDASTKKHKTDHSNKLLLYLMIGSAIIWPIASYNTVLFRMYYYYHVFLILFVPELLEGIKDKIIRLVIATGYVLVGVYYIYSQILIEEVQYYPYKFFWQ